MNDHHPKIAEDRLFFFEEQEVTVEEFDVQGYILDIGGGGQGVIGKLKGEQVIAIDPNRRELEGAADGPLKIVMDAGDLQFLDAAFNTATSFFSLMYIKEPDHGEVFSEVFRVLAPGGRFLIWDAAVPPRVDEVKDHAVFPLLVKLPCEEVTAGYGVLWPERARDLAYYVQLARDAGFEVVDQGEEDLVFHLELLKPNAVTAERERVS